VYNPNGTPLWNTASLEKGAEGLKKAISGRIAPVGDCQNQYVEALSGAGIPNYGICRLAKLVGSIATKEPIVTKLIARCFVNPVGPHLTDLFKRQSKHTAMSMTQLYASNPQQRSKPFFDEIFQQMTEFKIDLIESWLDDQPLAGGAAKRSGDGGYSIKRQGPLLWPNGPRMANIRATGHGCAFGHGARAAVELGYYEATTLPRMPKARLIDEFFVWHVQDFTANSRS